MNPHVRRPRVRIADPEGPPRLDPTGTARSVQAAELTVDRPAVEALWSSAGLDRLGRTYWRFLARISLGLIRVVPTPSGPLVVLLVRPLVLLAFGRPKYRLDGDRGLIRWPIHGGLLSARPTAGAPGDDRPDPDLDPEDPPTPTAGPEDRRSPAAGGVLWLELRRLEPADAGPETIRLELAVVDYRPAIARLLGPRVYASTQARIHVIVTHAFMRSLASMSLVGPPPTARPAGAQAPDGGPAEPPTRS